MSARILQIRQEADRLVGKYKANAGCTNSFCQTILILKDAFPQTMDCCIPTVMQFLRTNERCCWCLFYVQAMMMQEERI